MAAAGPDPSEPEQRDEGPPSMQVERVALDDGRALLLFTWDEPG